MKSQQKKYVPPLSPQAIKYQKNQFKGWQFFSSKAQMFAAKELDQIADVLPLQRLPDILFGNNRLLILNTSSNLSLQFNPITALSLANYEVRKKYLKGAKTQFDQSEPRPINFIDVIPHEVEVAQSKFWKDKDTSKIKDFKTLEIISDWTFSTPYKGSVVKISAYPKDYLPIPPPEKADSQGITIEITEQQIPYHRLGQDNKILFYDDIILFQDELDDSGGAKCHVRYRVMDDCFYCLLRYYLRVDGVAVRIFDTRIFHSFGDKEILREFQYQQASYEELKERGFKFGSDWSLNPNQGDLVLKFLSLKLKVKDKVKF